MNRMRPATLDHLEIQMILRSNYILLAVATLLLFGAIALIGCGSEQSGNADSHAEITEESHEGHNHAPGEHGEVEVSTTAASVSDPLDWCREHSVPESVCTKCSPSLIDDFKATGDWCAGHDLPESHCRLCNPGISFPQEEILRARVAEASEHDISVSLFFRPNTPVCATNDAIIQFASAETADRTGLSVHRVRAEEHASSLEAPAEIVFDEASSSVVTSTVPGLVSRWLVSPGDVIRSGEVLAIVQSPEIAELQAKLLSAFAANEVEQKEVARHEELKARQLISDSEYEMAVARGEQVRADYISTRGLLKSAGLSEIDLEDVIKFKKVSNQFALRAPADGVVIDRIAGLGDLIPAGGAFATIADPSKMWIEARLTEAQIRQVKIGQELTFSSDGGGLNQVGGRVIWVSRFLDPHTRTGTVRAEVIDPTHRLNAGEFGRVSIVEHHDRTAILVPKDAIQWEGCCNVVFVKESNDRFRPRKVEFHDAAGPYYQVTNGLDSGEEVVVDGAFLLKTELRKTSIGAGCCGIEPVG